MEIYVLILTQNEYIGAYTAVILKGGTLDQKHLFYELEEIGGLRNKKNIAIKPNKDYVIEKRGLIWLNLIDNYLKPPSPDMCNGTP